MKWQKFRAKIELIGINPFVFVPANILREICRQAGKDKGHIPVRGSVNRKSYKQTLVRYSGAWRLYINTTMLSITRNIARSIAFLTGDNQAQGGPYRI